MNHTARAVQSGEQTTVDEDTTDALLGALDDSDCRAILEAASQEALSASELSETCDLPLSTTYRKVDRLTDVGLLDEQLRLRRSGKHTGEYTLAIEQLHLAIDPETGIQLRVSGGSERGGSAPIHVSAD
jgi:DNA-binding transcriptional ArsR family regulator